MVPDKFVAWHAGVSCWKKHKNLNSRSIGIEIQNLATRINMKNFQKTDQGALLFNKNFKKKYKIKSKNFLGHSDISPDRKKDPGEKFPGNI